MKTRYFVALGVLSIAAIAWAAAEQRVDKVGSAFPMWFDKGLYIGPASPNPTNDKNNKVTRILGTSATIDVATVTAACNDSAGQTLTGAQVGDPCFVGMPTTLTGAGTGLSSTFTCYVSAANTVKLRHCPVGTSADDPASATYFFRVISSQ